MDSKMTLASPSPAPPAPLPETVVGISMSANLALTRMPTRSTAPGGLPTTATASAPRAPAVPQWLGADSQSFKGKGH